MAKPGPAFESPEPLTKRIGIAAGLAGVMLLVVVEYAPWSATVFPADRYAPPRRTDLLIASSEPAKVVFQAPSAAMLRDAFSRIGYDIDRVRGGEVDVPRLSLSGMPQGLEKIRDPAARKKFFLAVMLPLILEANQTIAGKRDRLAWLAFRLKTGKPLSAASRAWLARLAVEYRTKPDRIAELRKRVDIIPVSVALAQAATESGWGGSRFTLEGNALFGQWTTAGGRGLVPSDREEGMTHKVRAFNRPIDSVISYMRNLNTHRAYRKFRALRRQLRAAGQPLDGDRLAGELKSYSQRGSEYVEDLRKLMRANRLAPLDPALLNDSVPGGGIKPS